MKSLIKVDPRIHWDKKIPIVDEPVVIRVKEFTDESAELFSKSISKAHNTNQPVIPILIDSFGGSVYSLLSMISDITNSTLPIATVCIGKAMSCGAILLSFGNEGMRFCDPNATIMLHDISSVLGGKNEEIKSSSKQTDYLNKKIFKLMAKNCNQNSDYFLKKMDEKKHAEWYMTPQEAKKQKIINSISIPGFQYEIKLNIKFE